MLICENGRPRSAAFRFKATGSGHTKRKGRWKHGRGLCHRDASHHQGISGHQGERRRDAPAAPRRDPRAAGRKRRGQIDADERALRNVSAGKRHDQKGRARGQNQRSQRRHRAAYRHGASALQADRRLYRAGQHHTGRGGHAHGLPPEEAGARQGEGALRALRPGRRFGREGRGYHRGYAAARRDPQDALSRQRGADLRRADRRAYPAGDRRAD